MVFCVRAEYYMSHNQFFPEPQSIRGSGLSFIIIVKQRLFGMEYWTAWATIAKIAQGIDDDNLFGTLGRCDPALCRSATVVLVLLLIVLVEDNT